MLKSWSALPKWTVTGRKWGASSRCGSPEPGVSTKKSKRVASPAAVRAMRKPPPPRPVSVGSATAAANPAATTASKALPPASSASTAARHVAGCPPAITPCTDLPAAALTARP